MSLTPDGREEGLTGARGVMEDFDLDVGSQTTGTYRRDGVRATLEKVQIATEEKWRRGGPELDAVVDRAVLDLFVQPNLSQETQH